MQVRQEQNKRCLMCDKLPMRQVMCQQCSNGQMMMIQRKKKDVNFELQYLRFIQQETGQQQGSNGSTCEDVQINKTEQQNRIQTLVREINQQKNQFQQQLKQLIQQEKNIFSIQQQIGQLQLELMRNEQKHSFLISVNLKLQAEITELSMKHVLGFIYQISIEDDQVKINGVILDKNNIQILAQIYGFFLKSYKNFKSQYKIDFKDKCLRRVIGKEEEIKIKDQKCLNVLVLAIEQFILYIQQNYLPTHKMPFAITSIQGKVFVGSWQIQANFQKALKCLMINIKELIKIHFHLKQKFKLVK